MIRDNKLPEKPSIPGIREMEEKDVPQVTELLANFLGRFDMVPVYSPEEVAHQFLIGKGKGELSSPSVLRRDGQVTWAYVVEVLLSPCFCSRVLIMIPLQSPETKKITDFFSFYSLPSTIINNPSHSTLEAAYLYYYATDAAFQPHAEEQGILKQRLQELIGDALIIARSAQFDVFNALTMMDNTPFLNPLKVRSQSKVL